MNITFRTDASLKIGAGHVMRCLTLAIELRSRGHNCLFICRNLEGHLAQRIIAEKFDLRMLPGPSSKTDLHFIDQNVPHATWAEVPWRLDSEQTLANIIHTDWLVIDHYALDKKWEKATTPHGAKLLVIDDLADRTHHCNLLLDQNLGRTATDYDGLVPAQCKRLIGPTFTLLRPEFQRLRSYSLSRRNKRLLHNILITMGGIDQADATSKVLEVLAASNLPSKGSITVVIGSKSPWLNKIHNLSKLLPIPTKVIVDSTDMGSLMLNADLAIGAAGGTAWERLCLGLPSLFLTLADNQVAAAAAMETTKLAIQLGDIRVDGWQYRLNDFLSKINCTDPFSDFLQSPIDIIDGLGCRRCVTIIESNS